MNFPKRHCPLLIAVLLIIIAARESMSTDPTSNHHDPPFWQFILREYVFKTISSSGYQDDELHKTLLNAPFYGDSLPVASHDVNGVVSRGKVYNTPDVKWIFCQDDCTKCEPCDWQRGDPLVKWTLRRVKRLASSGLPKWGLRLTVVSQMDESFHISKHLRRRNDNYVEHQDMTGSESSHKLVSSSNQQAVNFDKINEENFWGPNRSKLYLGSNWSNDESIDDHRRSLVQAETYGSLRRPPLTYYDVDQDVNEEEITMKSSQDDVSPRLIVGIDQHGNRHLIHLVPVDALVDSHDRSNDYSRIYQRSHKRRNAARISRKLQQESDEPSYEKLIVKILESFYTHRDFIEKFLFADRLEAVDHNESAISSYSTYPRSADEKFNEGSFESYRFDDSRPVNQYPGSSEYQTEGEQLRRYPVMTRDVNKPFGEYQNQNSMIEYGPYGVSVQDQQQQHQGERSLPLANVDRKSRNSFGKLMDSTFGREAFIQNQTDASDIEFSMKRDFLQKSANQALVNLATKFNETNSRIRKLPEADFEIQTFGSDN